MKRRLFLASALISTLSLADCPQIDHTKKDTDGMPFCPALSATTSAWEVYRCAIEQGRSFHAPTVQEKTKMTDLLTTFKESTIKGIGAVTTAKILADADSLDLQTCRVVQDRAGVRDSFLLFYVKPGVKDYSGPFMMLRETKHSKVIIIGPHDDSDQTYATTKLGTQNTFALGTISNGHKRNYIPDSPPTPGGKHGDFVHENSNQNLGTFAVGQLANLFKNYIFLHFHGMADPSKVLYRGRNDVLNTLYEKTIMANTNIKDFHVLNAYFTVDPLVDTNNYIKTEIPVRIYTNNPMIVTSVVEAVEAQDWAWEK